MREPDTAAPAAGPRGNWLEDLFPRPPMRHVSGPPSATPMREGPLSRSRKLCAKRVPTCRRAVSLNGQNGPETNEPIARKSLT